MKFSFTFPKKKAKSNSVLSSPVRPHTDWRRFTASFLGLCLVIVAWSFYLYWASENNLALDPFRSNVANPSQKTSLERVDDFFAGREAARSASSSPVIDPSL